MAAVVAAALCLGAPPLRGTAVRAASHPAVARRVIAGDRARHKGPTRQANKGLRATIPIAAHAAPKKSGPAAGARIGVRHGLFIASGTRRPFSPLGLNYFEVGDVGGGHIEHAALNPGFYDGLYVNRMMAQAQAWGFNTVRTFQGYDVGPHGILTSADARQINPVYLANVIDFLKKAQAHHIHVIFTSDWSPASNWLASIPLPTESQYDLAPRPDHPLGFNALTLSASLVRDRANLIVQMIASIRRVDPALLNVVLAWELQNETAFDVTAWPFSQTSGSYPFAGRTYDLGSDRQKQALMDAITVQWANVSADAIHRADPLALVSDSVFTFAAVQRSGPGTLSQDKTRDSRVPARLLALAGTHLDFVDMHTYASRGQGRTFAGNAEADLSSEEWEALTPALRKVGKPILAGEIGLFRNDVLSRDGRGFDGALALSVLREHTRVVKGAGFAGALYWSYGSPNCTPEDPNPPMRYHPYLAAALTDVYRSPTRSAPLRIGNRATLSPRMCAMTPDLCVTPPKTGAGWPRTRPGRSRRCRRGAGTSKPVRRGPGRPRGFGAGRGRPAEPGRRCPPRAGRPRHRRSGSRESRRAPAGASSQ